MQARPDTLDFRSQFFRQLGDAAEIGPHVRTEVIAGVDGADVQGHDGRLSSGKRHKTPSSTLNVKS